VFDYFTRRRGLLTSNVGEAHAFIKTDAGLDEPDIELIFAPVPYLDHGDTEPPGHGYTVAAVLLQPESRGTIEPRSSNPAEAPAINPKYLAEEPDLRTLRAGVEKAAEIFETSPLSGFTGDWIRPERPMSSQEDVDRAIRGFSETLYHPAGTCRMGTDDLAVVDPDLRVHGIGGLRVADASVMPPLHRGPPHAPAVLIGEKAAELVTA
jgi:choline dehydrogenase